MPADEFGSMPFNLSLSLMYLIVGIAWGVLCFWFRYVMVLDCECVEFVEWMNLFTILTHSVDGLAFSSLMIFSSIDGCFCSDQLMPLQFWITGVMMVAMIETTMLYFHFIDWNEVEKLPFCVCFMCFMVRSLS